MQSFTLCVYVWVLHNLLKCSIITLKYESVPFQKWERNIIFVGAKDENNSARYYAL